jgi:hypothetical protein
MHVLHITEEQMRAALCRIVGDPGEGSHHGEFCTAWDEGQECCLEKEWLVAALTKALNDPEAT